jgi:hypothetical protein
VPVYLPNSLVVLTIANGEKTWGVDSDGNFSVGSNWIGGVAPGGIGDTATFSTIITAPRIVTLDADTTLGTLKFDSPISYTIAGSHALTLQASGSAAATISVSNAHGNGAHTISAPIALASDLSIVQNSGGVLRLAGPLDDSLSHAMTKSGNGTAEIAGAPTIGASTQMNVTGGTLRFALTSGSPTIGGGVTISVNSLATLELAGSVSALAAGSNRASIINSSTAPGILVSGTNQVVGAIDGTGTTAVNAGSDLTANHIVQGALIIGGTSGSPALVTIAASDAAGNPLATAADLALNSSAASTLAGASLFGAAAVASQTSFTSGASTDFGSTSTTLTSAVPGENLAAVPEPATGLMLAIGGAVLSAVSIGRRQRRRGCLLSGRNSS